MSPIRRSGNRFRQARRPESLRFQRQYRPGEEFTGKLIQAIVMSVLSGALFTLIFTSARLVKAHFVADYGSQAWLLPIGIGIIFLFMVYQLVRLWQRVIQLWHMMKNASKHDDVKGDS